MSRTTDSSTVIVENHADYVDRTIEGTVNIDQVVDPSAFSVGWNQPQGKVHLRPVNHPSPVTQLFEYTLRAWNYQKGDHCTYKYMSSRDPTLPVEIIATVLVRLPDKQPLLVRDQKPRMSRVQAQNCVAQLALEMLAADDADLAAELAAAGPSSPQPPAQFPRYQSNPGRFPRSPMQQYPAMYHPQQFFGYPPAPPPQFYISSRSNSAPELAEELPSPHPAYFIPPPIETGYGEDDSTVATPTMPHYQYYGYPPMTPQGWPGYPQDMMGYYPMMMMAPPTQEETT